MDLASVSLAAPHHLRLAPSSQQLQQNVSSFPAVLSARSPLRSATASVMESEEDLLRRLEDDILAAAADAAAKGPNGAKPAAAAALLRRCRRDRRWQQRILAVAAFRTEGQRRHLLEEDILSVAASVCSEMGSVPSGSYSLDESLLQPHQQRRLTQNASVGPGPFSMSSGGGGRWSAPAYGRSCPSVLTEEDEDVMDLIMVQAQTPGRNPEPGSS